MLCCLVYEGLRTPSWAHKLLYVKRELTLKYCASISLSLLSVFQSAWNWIEERGKGGSFSFLPVSSSPSEHSLSPFLSSSVTSVTPVLLLTGASLATWTGAGLVGDTLASEEREPALTSDSFATSLWLVAACMLGTVPISCTRGLFSACGGGVEGGTVWGSGEGGDADCDWRSDLSPFWRDVGSRVASLLVSSWTMSIRLSGF